MVISFPENTEEIIDAIRYAIGRDVTFNMVTYSGCSVCSLDTQTNTSVDSFCPTCSGLYYIPSYSGITVSGHITWKGSDTLQWPAGGQYFDGDCRLQIKYSDDVLEMVKIADSVDVDGKQMRVDDYGLRGVQNINRIVIQLSEEERET